MLSDTNSPPFWAVMEYSMADTSVGDVNSKSEALDDGTGLMDTSESGRSAIVLSVSWVMSSHTVRGEGGKLRYKYNSVKSIL